MPKATTTPHFVVHAALITSQPLPERQLEVEESTAGHEPVSSTTAMCTTSASSLPSHAARLWLTLGNVQDAEMKVQLRRQTHASRRDAVVDARPEGTLRSSRSMVLAARTSCSLTAVLTQKPAAPQTTHGRPPSARRAKSTPAPNSHTSSMSMTMGDSRVQVEVLQRRSRAGFSRDW